jgi:hypothetical protein
MTEPASSQAKLEDERHAHALTRRLFFLTMVGVIAYIGVVVALMSTVD